MPWQLTTLFALLSVILLASFVGQILLLLK